MRKYPGPIGEILGLGYFLLSVKVSSVEVKKCQIHR